MLFKWCRRLSFPSKSMKIKLPYLKYRKYETEMFRLGRSCRPYENAAKEAVERRAVCCVWARADSSGGSTLPARMKWSNNAYKELRTGPRKCSLFSPWPLLKVPLPHSHHRMMYGWCTSQPISRFSQLGWLFTNTLLTCPAHDPSPKAGITWMRAAENQGAFLRIKSCFI